MWLRLLVGSLLGMAKRQCIICFMVALSFVMQHPKLSMLKIKFPLVLARLSILSSSLRSGCGRWPMPKSSIIIVTMVFLWQTILRMIVVRKSKPSRLVELVPSIRTLRLRGLSKL